MANKPVQFPPPGEEGQWVPRWAEIDAETGTVVHHDQPPPGQTAYVTPTCKFCNREQPFRVGSQEPGSHIWNFGFTCSFCGQRNESPGVHQVSGDGGTLKMVFHDMTIEQLRELENAVHAAVVGAESAAEVAGAVESTSPELAGWIRSQANRMELWQIITIVLALITIWMAYAQKNEPPPTPTQINQVIVNVETGNTRDLPIPRNAKCFCDSGLKFKKCHGAPSVGSAVDPGSWLSTGELEKPPPA